MVRHDGSVARVGKIVFKIGACREGVVMTLSRPLCSTLLSVFLTLRSRRCLDTDDLSDVNPTSEILRPCLRERIRLCTGLKF